MSQGKDTNGLDMENLGGSNSWDPAKTVLRVMLVVLIIGAAFVIRSAIVDQVGPQELENGLAVIEPISGWVDKQTDQPGEVSIVPSITFKVKNVGTKPLEALQFIGIFEFIEGGEQIGDGNIPFLKKTLEPGQSSDPIIISSRFGYTASSKEAFIKNAAEWKQVRVRLMVRKNSGPGKLGTFEVARTIAGLNAEILPLPPSTPTAIAQAVRIEEIVAKWMRKEVSGKQIIYPFARIRIKNIGQIPFGDLIFKAEFLFEDGTQQINAEYPGIKAGLAANALSEELVIRSEFGLEAQDLQSFYKNPYKWQLVKIKIYVKTVSEPFFMLGTYETKKEIEGVKLVY